MLHRMNVAGSDNTSIDGKDAVSLPGFAIWFDCLDGLAKSRGLSHLIGAAEGHGSAFVDGLSPEEELRHQLHEAAINDF